MEFSITKFLTKLAGELVQIDIDGDWLVGEVIGHDHDTGWIKVLGYEGDDETKTTREMIVNLRHVTSILKYEEPTGDN